MYRNYDFGYGGPPRRRGADFPYHGPPFHPGFGDPYYGPSMSYGEMPFRGPMRPRMPWPRAPQRGVSDWGTQLINRQIKKTQQRILSQTVKPSNGNKTSEKNTATPKLDDGGKDAGSGREQKSETMVDPTLPIGPRISAKQMWENSYREKITEEKEATSSTFVPNPAPKKPRNLTGNKKKNSKFRKVPYYKRKKKAASSEEAADDKAFPRMCQTCNVQLTGADQAKTHNESDLHKQNVKKYSTGDSSNVNIALDKLNQTLPLPTNTPDCLQWEADTGDRTLNTVRFCRLCSVRMTSLLNAKQHYEGKSHAKRIRIVQRGNRPVRKPFKPTPFISGGVLGMQARSIPTTYNYGATFVQAEPQLKLPAATISVKSSLPGEFVNSQTPSGQYYCATCNVVIEHSGRLSMHLQSKEHKLAKASSR